MKTLLFSPSFLLQRAMNIEGWEMSSQIGLEMNEIFHEAELVAEEWSEDWDEDQGFGSSDMTYAIQGFLDGIGLETTFDPYLKIVGIKEHVQS